MAITPPEFASKARAEAPKEGDNAGGKQQARLVISILGKAYGRMGLVRAARAVCAAGVNPADVTGDVLVAEMFRPKTTAAPAGEGRSVDTSDEQLAADLAATASEPELAINMGPAGVFGDFLPWQVRSQESVPRSRRSCV